jgi:hypothetical protein
MGRSEPAEKSVQPLRILEVGGERFFHLAVPSQTEFCWTGNKPRGHAEFVLGPAKMVQIILSLRRGEFDLLVVHSMQYPPWHPRSFLTTLRDWHFRSPQGLFAIFAWRFVHLFHNVPIAAIDLSDSCLVGRHNFFLLNACKLFFKRELPSDHWLVFCKSGYPNFPGRRWRSKNSKLIEKFKPISYGAPSMNFGHLRPSEQASSPEKKADIFFAGSVFGNSTARHAGLLELRALEKEGYVIDLPMERMTEPEFFKRMSAAWLAWSPGGLGWDCGRHYEASIVGTVPLINHPTILRDTPLRENEHCVFYAVEPGGLMQAARKALADKPRLREMARAAAAHVVQHHNLYARAERVTSLVLGRCLDGTRIDTKETSQTGIPDEFRIDVK